jgi:DNA polymerase III subunit epsilon
MELLEQPVATAEYLAVDCETNGLAGESCELTEVGAVLVGGGELHDSWDSLVRVERPLSRGIQRFTGITQAMLDTAPPPEEVLPTLAEMLDGRVLVAHSARFDSGVLRLAFDRCGLEWPAPPVICTVALSHRFAPLATRRRLAVLAESLGVEVEETHRALPDATTCARIFCALFPKLCANAGTVAEALELLRPRRRTADPARRRSREERPDLSRLPEDPGVYIFRDERGRPLYVGKSVSLRTRARAHFCAPAGWTERAEIVDYRPTNSELGALVLENRLIKRWRPPGNRALRHTDRWVYLRARLDIPFPVLEVAPEPAPGLAINVGPLGGRSLAEELAGQLESLFKLRRCGRRLKLRENPSLYGQMDRCMSPCLGDLDPNAYRRKLDEALGLFERPGGGERLLALMDERMREASEQRRYERAASLRRRRERLEWLLDRLEGVLRATQAAPRLVVARHPAKERYDAFWISAGRVADWGPLSTREELEARTGAVLERSPSSARPVLPPDEVDEVRIVAGWLAEHQPPELVLADGPEAPEAARWAQGIASPSWKRDRVSTSSSRATPRGARSLASMSRAS